MQRVPNLSSLRYFLLVAGTRNFSEAAKLANLSQPALSRTIKLLEEELGARLFDRNSRNVALTPAGESLLPIVERLTGDLDRAFEELRHNFAGERGRIVVGALPSIAWDVLPRAIADFAVTHPQVEILIREGLAENLTRLIGDRQVDFALSTPPSRDEALDFTPLHDDPFVLVCRSSDAGHFDDPAPWASFADWPFIGMEVQSSVRRLTDRAFAKVGLDIGARYECNQLATVGGLIAQGLGISLLPGPPCR